MIEEALKNFANRIGVDVPVFDREHPVSFRVDGDLEYSLEYRSSDDLSNEDLSVSVPLDLILSLRIPVAEYDNERYFKFLEHSSFCAINLIPFTVGASKTHMLLMTDIPVDVRAEDLENSILLLKRQFEEIIKNG